MSRSTKKIPLVSSTAVSEANPGREERDHALLHELILLVSNLEYLRVQLEKLTSRRKRTEALQLMTFMMDETVAVAERHRSGMNEEGEFALVLAEVGQFYSAAQSLRKLSSATSLRSLFGLLRTQSSDGTPPDLQQTADLFLTGIFRVLALFGPRFESPSAAGEWAQAVEVFQTDLRQVVDSLEN